MTTTTRNWSERNELHDPTGKVHDCYVAAPLDCLSFGGKHDYEFGEYTALEREALERSDTRPDEEGGTPDDADLAIKNRYGLALHKPASTDTKRGILTTPNLMVSVGGRPIDAPVDSIIRHYLPNYAEGHRGSFATTEKLYFDPMAPMGSPGQPCSVEDVLAFSSSRAVTDYRYSMRDEYATSGGINQPEEPMGFQFSVSNPPASGLVTFDKGDPAWRLVDNVEIAISVGGVHDGYGAISKRGTPGYIVNHTQGGVTQAYFMRASDVTFVPQAGDTTHVVTVAVDGATKATVTV